MTSEGLENSISVLSVADDADLSLASNLHAAQPQRKGKNPDRSTAKKQSKGKPSQSTKLRGMDRDSEEVRVSKTLTWLLRHNAQNEGLHMRSDGYVRVKDVLNHPKIKTTGLDIDGLQELVKSNDKQRYELILETSDGDLGDTATHTPVAVPALEVGAESSAAVNAAESIPKKGVWWIRARQGHSIKNVELQMKPILTLSDIPTGIAVHGTTRKAWESICQAGLSKMARNHIHIAQDVAAKNVVSGMRTSSQILVYIDVTKAIKAGIKFWLSGNGVVLTEGDDKGFLSPKFFQKVVDLKHGELHGWELEE